MKDNTIHILSTRPVSQNILKAAESNNINIDVISFIETHELNDENIYHEIDRLSKLRSAVIFTSMNAVSIVAKHISNVPEWKIYCIGNTTKELVTKYFGSENIAAVGSDSEELAMKIINDKVSEATFFCGDIRKDYLPKVLINHSINLSELVVYKTIETPVKVSTQYSGILFYSPSAVRSFFSINTIDNYSVLYSIGKTTTEEIKHHSSNQIITVENSDKELMALQMIAQISELNRNKENNG